MSIAPKSSLDALWDRDAPELFAASARATESRPHGVLPSPEEVSKHPLDLEAEPSPAEEIARPVEKQRQESLVGDVFGDLLFDILFSVFDD
jgi:hypothetical protein